MLGLLAKAIVMPLRKILFSGSGDYWEGRYAHGGNSGDGSYGGQARYKADVINSFVREQKLDRVIEFGCGDGSQLALVNYKSYIGLDVSKTAIKLCKKRFERDETKSFFLYDSDCFVDRHSLFKAELVLSLDVIYHLVEDMIFELYMCHLFDAADKFVVIYSTNADFAGELQSPHVKHRQFSRWVEKNLPVWKLLKKIPNPYSSEWDKRKEPCPEFFIYERVS